jgi:putative ABC transport system ATP-binding protein
VLGTDIAQFGGAARDRFRGEHFCIIFQMFNLLPYGSVLDNVLLPLSFAAEPCRRASAKGTAEEEAARLLEKLGIEPALRKASAASLARTSVASIRRPGGANEEADAGSAPPSRS